MNIHAYSENFVERIIIRDYFDDFTPQHQVVLTKITDPSVLDHSIYIDVPPLKSSLQSPFVYADVLIHAASCAYFFDSIIKLYSNNPQSIYLPKLIQNYNGTWSYTITRNASTFSFSDFLPFPFMITAKKEGRENIIDSSRLYTTAISNLCRYSTVLQAVGATLIDNNHFLSSFENNLNPVLVEFNYL